MSEEINLTKDDVDDETFGTVFPLEEECQCCHGAGQLSVDSGDGWWTCSECDGAGFEPTAAGKKILDLIRHNMKSLLNLDD